MEKFILNQQSNIIIYGAATTGSLLVDRLEKEGLKIKGFIDKRAYEIESLKGYPVWSIESKELKDQIDDDTILVIAVKNVFQHASILRQLIQHTRCEKYIYMPIGELNQEQKCMKNTFNDLLYEKIEFPYELEKVMQVRLNNFHREDNRKEVEKKVVVLVPVGFVYTNYSANKKNIWMDIPILAYYPHIRLFQYFDNNEQGGVESYLNFCVSASEDMQIVQSQAWKNNIIDNRKNVYDQMLEEYELFTDFFFKNAPTAKWNDKGYFNLTSGKHRAAFLAAKGRRFIPLKISLEDEAKWLNCNIAENAFMELQEKDVTGFSHAIDNPYFYRYKNCYGEFWHKVLCDVVCKMAEHVYDTHGKVSFNDLRVLNMLDENRYLARYLYKMGAVITDVKSLDEVERIVDRLFHCTYVPRMESMEKYDLLIIDYLKAGTLKNLDVQFVVCLQCDECFKDKARRIANTVNDKGSISAYFVVTGSKKVYET